MTQHPYVGLAGTISIGEHAGTAVTVASVNDAGCAQLLTATGEHIAMYLAGFTVDDPAEARRRLMGEWSGPDAYQGSYTLHDPVAPCDEPTDGYEPCGPWRMVTAVNTNDPGYHPSDPHQATMFVFERPLRRVSRG